MSKKSKESTDKVIIHGTSEGKLFIEESEFFNNNKVKAIFKKLFKSNIYKELKQKQA